MIIDIKGLGKHTVLAALVNATGPEWVREVYSASEEDAAKLLNLTLRVDYFFGRKIGIDFTFDQIDARIYDRDAGAGAAQVVVDRLRAALKE